MSNDTWQYAVLLFVADGYAWLTGGDQQKWPRETPIVELLDQAGADGWELVALDATRNSEEYVFKRRVPQT